MTYPSPPGGYQGSPYPPPGYPGAYGPVPYAKVVRPTDVFGRRIGAFFIDFGLLMGIVFVMFFSLATHETHSSIVAAELFCADINDNTPNLCVNSERDSFVIDENQAAAIGLAGLGYTLVNYVVLTGLTGFSLGKAIVGIRCVKTSTGTRCGLPRAALRTVLFFVPDMVCAGIVGLITAAVSDGHRRVGDFASGTAVVHKNAVGQPPLAPPATGYGYPTYPQQPYPPQAYPPQTYPPQPYPTAPQQFPPAAAPTGSSSYQMPAPASPPSGAAPPTPAAQTPAAPTMAWPTTETAGEPTTVFSFEPTTAMAPVEPAAPAASAASAPPGEKRAGVDEPLWDQNRNTYIQWDPELNKWMQWNDSDKRWDPI